MINIKKIKKGVKLFVLLNFFSQAFSLVTTIWVARILTPSDYGLIEMAGIFVGYIVLFGQLGVGVAVVQRKQNTQEELSSLFWFMCAWGGGLCLVGVLLAYPTSWLFDNTAVIRLTQVSSIMFLAGGISIVPRNILERNMKFGIIGVAEGGGAVVSSCVMLIMAKLGFGVWTLIVGQIVKEYFTVITILCLSNWKPSLFFCFDKIRPYLKFGLNVAFTNSLYYVYSKSDRFLGGKFFGSRMLGEYSFTLQLSMIPRDKIVYFINRFAFPLLAANQGSSEDLKSIYLKLLRVISFVICPLYAGGCLLANDLILSLLGDKWNVIIFPFQVLCLTQIVLSISSLNKFVINAIGKPSINLYFSIASMVIIPVAFFICAKTGFFWMLIPWVTVIPVIALMHHFVLIKMLNISFLFSLRGLFHGIVGSLVMSITILLLKEFFLVDRIFIVSNLNVVLQVIVGAAVYFAYCYSFNREMLSLVKSLR
ncbi:MAG: lipopolysaccharide biosynthesis protein [Candidatus Electrothrix sp. GM3_4]|nr:lipopolysaccharide biosynthesis protein [Candidatus Electrothrix sp. GM3_4]